MRSVLHWSEQRQPTIRLEDASRTAASQNTSCPHWMRVASATHSRFGAAAVKTRLTSYGAGVAAGLRLVELLRHFPAKEPALQAELGPGDRFFRYTTTGSDAGTRLVSVPGSS